MNTQTMNDLIKLIKNYSEAQSAVYNTSFKIETRAIAQSFSDAILTKIIKLQKKL